MNEDDNITLEGMKALRFLCQEAAQIDHAIIEKSSSSTPVTQDIYNEYQKIGQRLVNGQRANRPQTPPNVPTYIPNPHPQLSGIETSANKQVGGGSFQEQEEGEIQLEFDLREKTKLDETRFSKDTSLVRFLTKYIDYSTTTHYHGPVQSKYSDTEYHYLVIDV